MGIFYFPSNFVYWRKVPNHEIFKKRILEYIKNNPDEYSSNVLINNGKTNHGSSTCNSFLMNWKEFVNFVIWDTLKEAIIEIDSRKNTPTTNITCSRILTSWCIKYDKDSSVALHNHQSSGRECFIIDNKKWFKTFTILYIINDPNEKSSTEFVQTNSHGVSSHLEQQLYFRTSTCKNIGEGTVFAFPSNLDHQALSISKPGRVIFSCDIISEFL